jgi:FkbM family methyltransferase
MYQVYVMKQIPPLFGRTYEQWIRLRTTLRLRKLFVNYSVYNRALSVKGAENVTLKTRDGLAIVIRQNLWDARIVREIFGERPYLSKSFRLPAKPIVVDIGGYIGDFSIYAAKYLNATRVIVYEPTMENFRVLQANIETNNLADRVEVVNKAVSNLQEVSLNIESSECQEIHVSAYWYESAPKRVVPSVTLSELFTTHRLESVDLLKIDCEGGEYDILPLAPLELLRRVHHIVFEFHMFTGYEQKLDSILENLRNAGFLVETKGPIVYAHRPS